jgi:hypothetical protein
MNRKQRREAKVQKGATPLLPETFYRSVVIEAQELPDGKVGLVIHTPGEVLVFPMPPEYAERVAGDLTAGAINIQSGNTPIAGELGVNDDD